MPTYAALAQTPDGLAFAKGVFEKARPGYHPITIGSVEQTLDRGQGRSADPMARRLAVAVSLGLALTTVGVAVTMPERVLDAEFARQRWLAGASVHTLRVGDHDWTYLEAGQGPLIVMLHGFTGAKENWLPVMRQLARTHRVIAPDLPGWGESERQASSNYGPGVQVERIAQFLRALQGKTRARGRPFDGRAVHRSARRAPSGTGRTDRADVLGRREIRRERLRSRRDGWPQSVRGAHAAGTASLPRHRVRGSALRALAGR